MTKKEANRMITKFLFSLIKHKDRKLIQLDKKSSVHTMMIPVGTVMKKWKKMHKELNSSVVRKK